jgi:3-dehydroquinate synthase
MKVQKLIINTKSKTYPIYFGNDILNSTGQLVKKKLPYVKKICIIIDNKLSKILVKKLTNSLKNYTLKILYLRASEKNKNILTVNKIIEQLLEKNFNRSDCVIAFGGGIIGDVSALISNLTKRGLKFINIPTTLLAQVDASIGGKTGVNSHQGKNLIGTYYQPDFVLSDVTILESLSHREMIAGYGEILKHSLILDKKFFLWLLRNGKNIIQKKSNKVKEAIIKSCKIKNSIVSKDENEKNLRKNLNFGHTFAHGFEGANNYSKKLNHGEAVLLGIFIANKLSNKKKLLSSKQFLQIKKHYLDLNLPMNLNKNFKKNNINKIVYFMSKDKKNVDKKINLILLKSIGKTKNIKLHRSEIKKFLNSFF